MKKPPRLYSAAWYADEERRVEKLRKAEKRVLQAAVRWELELESPDLAYLDTSQRRLVAATLAYLKAKGKR